MSETTNIEWATSTGNPWIGCTKVSPGCKNCYAATLDHNRFSRTMGGGTKDKPVSHWGKGAPRFRTKTFWKDAIKWNRIASIPHCTDTFGGTTLPPRPRIFPSLCDWLDDEVPIEWLVDFLKLIHDTPNLDWLLLTKRPENFLRRLSDAHNVMDAKDAGSAWFIADWAWIKQRPPANVWTGTSVEDQQRADERIPELLKIPAKVRFLSVEPLLGPVELDPNWLGAGGRTGDNYQQPQVHWVIVGGESGPGARACTVEWIRSIVQQCAAAGVPCFVKQLGSNPRARRGLPNHPPQKRR